MRYNQTHTDEKKITKKNWDGNYVSTKEVENLHLKSVSHLIPFP